VAGCISRRRAVTVYVDTLVKHDLSGKSAQVQRVFKDGACHMFTDSEDLNELHDMAQRIGMRLSWFQDDKVLPHYDLNENRRAAAVRAGAVECDKYKTVEVMRANRARRKA
jgi:hypothetical protein